MPSDRTARELKEILNTLRGAGNRAQKERAAKRGIPEKFLFGVPKSIVQKEATRIGKNQQLAEQLWSSGYHEARLLAILIAEPELFPEKTCNTWIMDLWTWDLTDSFARYLLPFVKGREELIEQCFSSTNLYERRLAFAGIACTTMKDPENTRNNAENYFRLIRTAAADERHHVRKAVVWALVEIGKVSEELQEEALILASELVEEGGSFSWVGRNARKELESLTTVKERRRLLSTNSKTARKQRERSS